MPKSFFRKLTKKFFISVNIILASVFLLGCYASWFNPQHWWFLGFLTLAAFYLLLFLIAFIFFWLLAYPRYGIISLLTILLAYKPINNIIPFRLGQTFIKEKRPQQLRIMSWNVENFGTLQYKVHPEKKEQIEDLINEYDPDIACFQEMVASDSITNAINYIPALLQKLNFTGYHYSYNSKLDFDNLHHFGLVIFSKYPIIKKHTASFYPYDYNSIFQYVNVVRDTDTIRIFNIHLQSLKFSASNLSYINNPSVKDEAAIQKSKNIFGKLKAGFMKRKVQAERIREEIDKSPYPVIICGDFNDVPNSYAYNLIGNGMKNAFVEKGSGLGRTFSGISPTLRIDNIFVDKKFSVEQFMRIDKKLSDHFLITADITLK